MVDSRIFNEIEHGKYLAKHGAGEIWNWETEAGKKRWKRRVDLLTEKILPEMELLELGCGTGYFTKELVKTKANIIAIDISDELLNIAKNDIKDSNVIFKKENAYATSFQNNRFDIIMGCSVLHHLDIKSAIKELYRILKPGGQIFFSEPNMLNPQIALQKNIPYIKKKLGDSPDETAFIRWKLFKMLQHENFINIKISPFDFLHPATPKFLIPFIEKLGDLTESIPVFKEIAGSLFISGNKKL